MKILSIVSVCLLLSFTTFSQIVSFPGAEGAGKFTSGGRGTTSQLTRVFEVTNLNDNNVAGTLRYACSQAATYRTIVFRISGTIHLSSRLTIPANTTIAGQTAPGDGICLADYPVALSGDNIIIRYIRCRMGDKNQLKTSPAGCGVPVKPFTSACMPLDGSGGDDALGDLGHKNIIIDHCSVSWSSDEALTVYRGDSVTLQWNFITEPLNYSYHFETGDTDFEQHGYGGIQGGRHASMHHNLFAHCRNRTPRFAGISTYTPLLQGSDMADFSNNVIYNWGINNIYGGEGGYYNVVNNYFKPGPSTTRRSTQIVGIDSGSLRIYAKYYLTGNFITSSTTNTNNNWRGVTMESGNLADTQYSKVTTRFDLPAINLQTPAQAYDDILASAGCSLPNRDTLDQRIVNNVKNGTGRFIDVQGGYPHGTPYDQTVNAWPTLNSTPPPQDTDQDGMPDTWEVTHLLNPLNAADRGGIAPSGYTWLEEYLNDIVAQAALPLKLTSFTGSLVQKQVRLTWSTTNEVNTDKFVIERSADGISFAPISNVATLNSRATTNNYSFNDLKPLDGKSYYRLKLVDKDGAYTFSQVISFNSIAKAGLSVNPNPVLKQLVVTHPKAAPGALLQVYSSDGKLQVSYKVTAGAEQSSYNVNSLSSGIYSLMFINNNERINQRFVKQ